MESLVKFQQNLTNEICNCLVNEEVICKDVKNLLEAKLQSEDISAIRNTALRRFKELTEKQMNELYKEDNIDNKFDSLKELTNQAAFKYGKENKGWRPCGQPVFDSYGLRQPLLLSHVERLEKVKAELEKELLI